MEREEFKDVVLNYCNGKGIKTLEREFDFEFGPEYLFSIIELDFEGKGNYELRISYAPINGGRISYGATYEIEDGETKKHIYNELKNMINSGEIPFDKVLDSTDIYTEEGTMIGLNGKSSANDLKGMLDKLYEFFTSDNQILNMLRDNSKWYGIGLKVVV